MVTGAYGIYEASLTYFDKEPKELNIAESAILASLPNAPDTLNPYGSDSAKNKLKNRQKLVLNKMLELGLIKDEEYNNAINYNIEYSNGSSKIIKNNPAISPYINVALSEAIALIKQTYSCKTRSEAIDILLKGKSTIILNLDIDLQNDIYQIAKDSYQEYPELELGGVMTNKSGEVLAIISSRRNSQLNHAYNITRQTGSSIKPLSVYGPAYDMGILNPNSLVEDEPVSVTTYGKTWNVENASNTFRGTVSVNDAIAYSLNTVAVTTLEQVGIAKSYEYLKSFGITTIDNKNDMYYPALALGGLSKGVSPYEMAQAYNALSNDGKFSTISTIKYIEISGKKFRKERNEHQVISVDAAHKLKTSLNCGATYGTGKLANLSNTTTYIKTGTTSNRKDVWTCGFTDDVTLAIWGGYDTPARLPIYNLNIVWKNIMENYYSR